MMIKNLLHMNFMKNQKGLHPSFFYIFYKYFVYKDSNFWTLGLITARQ